MKHIGLLPLVLLAIVLGVVAGNLFPEGLVRLFVTFNSLFGAFLSFMIPLIIFGLVAPAIADIGEGAGRMLLVTVVLAYADTVLAGLIGYGTGTVLFPGMIDGATKAVAGNGAELTPFFELKIPPLMDVMSALIFAFIVGIGIIYTHSSTLHDLCSEFRNIVSKVIGKVIIPLLPLYIFGIFADMTFSGRAYHILLVFIQIILVIVVLHLFILLYEFVIAGLTVRRNPLRLLWTMLPAYLTALGTSSSATTIPVTLQRTEALGVNHGIAGFTVPLCATIHLPGSMMKITCCALAVCLMCGLEHNMPLFIHFILLLAVCMVAAPGVPGGAVMAALGPLQSVLGFDADMQALIIALYIAMDSFGTACNVTSDGAISLIIDHLFRKRKAKD